MMKDITTQCLERLKDTEIEIDIKQSYVELLSVIILKGHYPLVDSICKDKYKQSIWNVLSNELNEAFYSNKGIIHEKKIKKKLFGLNAY